MLLLKGYIQEPTMNTGLR